MSGRSDGDVVGESPPNGPMIICPLVDLTGGHVARIQRIYMSDIDLWWI